MIGEPGVSRMIGEPTVPRGNRYYWPLNPRKPKPDVRFLDPNYYKGIRGADGRWLVPPGYWHTGIDLNGPGGGDSDCGQPVHAMTDGYVVFAGRLPVWGGVVVLRHPHAGVWTRYGHLRDILVKRGEAVPAGAQIGTVGKMTTGGYCHLHFDVFVRQPPASEGLWGFFPRGGEEARQKVLTYCTDPEAFLNKQAQAGRLYEPPRWGV
jgi:murein DD-endopeptidase MepM/ murein hydrolase activator NlpD